MFGRLDHGLELAQHFVHENRIRQAASSLGAAQFCIDEAVAYANERITWGKTLSTNQGIQFPLVELHTEAAMLRQLIRSTAWQMDDQHHMEVTHLVAMCNYRANRLACDAADRAMQTCGGIGYSRHMPFEHIYRHHRRYRITEGSRGDPDAQGRPAPLRVRTSPLSGCQALGPSARGAVQPPRSDGSGPLAAGPLRCGGVAEATVGGSHRCETRSTRPMWEGE